MDLDVLSLCPLPVGIAPLRAQNGPLVVIVKAPVELKYGVASLADEQDPIGVGRASRFGVTNEPDAPDDFVPAKANVDVLLVGHAHARTNAPGQVIRARLSIEGINKRFY